MKILRKILGVLFCLALIPAAVLAQEQPKNLGEAPATHIRVDVLLTEFSGRQKVSSLPYSMYVKVPPLANPHPQFGRGYLRIGVNVPVASGRSGASYGYEDVGTRIDCMASAARDGGYDIELRINRSSVYSADSPKSDSAEIHGIPDVPVIRNFNSDFDLKMHDGETAEGPSATDPFNGHVLKVSVTLHVVR